MKTLTELIESLPEDRQKEIRKRSEDILLEIKGEIPILCMTCGIRPDYREKWRGSSFIETEIRCDNKSCPNKYVANAMDKKECIKDWNEFNSLALLIF